MHSLDSTFARQAGVTGLIRLDGDDHIFAEIAFPPFGYVLSMNSPTIDARLLEITAFGKCGFNEYRELFLKLPVLHTSSPFPGDFRSTDELVSAYKENTGHGAV